MRKTTFVSIGINDYPGSGMDLAGCVNDSQDISDELTFWGATGIRLTDAQATKAAVVHALRRMTDGLGYLDTLVVHYSGHGTFVADTDGDEADGRDEAWVCHDYASGGILTDDELQRIFEARRWGSRIVMLSDSCHSGTLSRFASTTVVNAAAGVGMRRFMPPDVALSDSAAIERAERVSTLPAKGRSRSSAALLAGCKDSEYSYDAWFTAHGRQRANGAFTQALVSTMHSLQGPPSNLADWYARVRTVLPSSRFAQTPQLTATRTQRHWRPWPRDYARP